MKQINTETVAPAEKAEAETARNAGVNEAVTAGGKYTFVCYGPDEKDRSQYCRLRAKRENLNRLIKHSQILAWIYSCVAYQMRPKKLAQKLDQMMECMIVPKWVDCIQNAVTGEGKNYVLDKAFAGSAFTAAWYLGLFNSSYSPTGSETYASKGGTENTNYSNGTRPAASWSAASGGSKALSAAASFSINGAGGTIAGAFLTTNSTKGDSTSNPGVNVMYSIGAFSGGNKEVANGDTLNVSYSTSLT